MGQMQREGERNSEADKEREREEESKTERVRGGEGRGRQSQGQKKQILVPNLVVILVIKFVQYISHYCGFLNLLFKVYLRKSKNTLTQAILTQHKHLLRTQTLLTMRKLLRFFTKKRRWCRESENYDKKSEEKFQTKNGLSTGKLSTDKNVYASRTPRSADKRNKTT